MEDIPDDQWTWAIFPAQPKYPTQIRHMNHKSNQLNAVVVQNSNKRWIKNPITDWGKKH